MLVLIIALNVFGTTIEATVDDKRYIDGAGAVAMANHTTNAITAKSTSTSGSKTLNPIQSMSSTKVLSRRKRFIAFPEGSSFSVSFSRIICTL